MERRGKFPQMYQFIWSTQYQLVSCSSSIEIKFALDAGSVSNANDFVNCDDIWTNTNLSICVPTFIGAAPPLCTLHTQVADATTCAAVSKKNGVSAAWIKAWNPWVDCGDIWKGTDLCLFLVPERTGEAQ